MSRWTRDKFRRIIIDLHLPDFSPEIGKKLDAERIVDCAAKAGCEVLIFPTKSHFGLTTYATAAGTRHPNIPGDLFADVVELGHRRDLKVVAYYSVGWDEAFRKGRPECEQRTFLGTPVVIPPLLGYGAPWTMMCLNTAYRDHCFEQMRELLDYPVDGFWLDITYYPPHACYCEACRRSFRERSGGPIPGMNWDDPRWRDFVQFKTDVVSRFFADAAASARERDPDMPLTFNLPPPDSWAISGQQAGVAQQVRHMTFASSEVHFDMYGTLSLPVEVEVNTALGRDPPETILCRFADGWDWTVKPEEQLSAECLGAMARGSAVMVIDHAYPDGGLESEAYEVIGKVFRRMERAADWVKGTRPKPFAAVLLSERTLFAYGREDPTRHVFPFYGVCRTLLESHIPFRVVTDSDVEERLTDCRVLILPNAASMTDAACREVKGFVESGGTLLATYRTSFLDENGERRTEPGLADLFNAAVTGEVPSVHYVRLAGGEELLAGAPSRPIPLYGPSLLVKAQSGAASGGRIVKPFPLEKGQFFTHGFAPPGPTTDHPVWVISEKGEGKAVYFPGRICESLLSGDPELRRLLAAAVSLAPGGIPLRVEGPRCLDVSWRVRDDADILHLVNIQYPTGRTFPVLSPESYWTLMRESGALFPAANLPASTARRLLRLGLKSYLRLNQEKAIRKFLEAVDRLPKRGVEVADRVPAASDVTLRVRKRSGSPGRVFSPFSGDLDYEEGEDGFIAVTVPRIAVHEIVVLRYG